MDFKSKAENKWGLRHFPKREGIFTGTILNIYKSVVYSYMYFSLSSRLVLKSLGSGNLNLLKVPRIYWTVNLIRILVKLEVIF